jgi:phage minor structural protein, N-terminal domain protein
MRPILYEQDETLFRTNGIGILHDAEECKVTEARNGKFEIELVYPLQGEWITDIVHNRIILSRPNDYDQPHAFRIYETAVDLAANHMTVKGVSITDDLAGNVVKPFTVLGANPNSAWAGIRSAALDNIRYRFWSDISAIHPFEVSEAQNVWATLVGEKESLVSVFGGEVKRENDSIYLYRRRGTDHVTTIRPRKNLKNIKITTNMIGKFTRILPYAKYTPEGENQQEQTIYGDVIFSDHYNDYSVKRIVPIDISKKFNDYKQQQKASRKDQLKADRENNRAIDASRRSAEEARREQLEIDREAARERRFEERQAARASARVAAQEKRAAAKAAREANRGIKKSKAQRDAEAEARYQAREAAYQQKEAERSAKFQQQETDRRAKRAAAKQAKIDKKNAREAEKSARKARQDQIKENTKIVITPAMVTSEASSYFDENPNVDVPNIKIEVDMIPLQDTTSWERSMLRSLEKIKLCDTIDVYVKKIDADVTVTVNEIEYDVLSERIIKIVATSDGNNSSSLAEAQRAEWKDHTQKAISDAFFDIDNSVNKILTSANGKNQNFYGPDEPPADMAKENDIWFKEVAEGEIDMYRFDGTQWILLMPHDFGEQLETKINDLRTEIQESLDEFEESQEDLKSQLDGVAIDAQAAVEEVADEFNAEIASAKSALDTVKRNFEAAKADFNNKLADLSQKQLADKSALIQQTQRDIRQLQDGITEKYNNLRIGTNNLIRNSITMPPTDFKGWTVANGETFRLYSKDLTVLKINSTSRVALSLNPPESNMVKLRPNQDYIFSFYVKSSGGGQVIYHSRSATDLQLISYDSSYHNGWNVSREWERHWVKFRTPSTLSNPNAILGIINKDRGTNTIYTAAWQLEESHILSDWHPNDTDLEEVIGEYKRLIDRNLTTLQTTVGKLGENVTNVKTSIDQTNRQIELKAQEITGLKGQMSQAEATLRALPAQITAQVNTAKEDAINGSKSYTNAQIKVAEGSIAQRITSNLTGQVNGIISSSITQTNGAIRQAIASATENAVGTARTNAQTIVNTAIDGIRTNIRQVETKIPKKYGGRNYLQGTDKARHSGSYTLNSNGYSVIFGYNTVGNKTLRELGIPQNAKLTLQYTVKFASNVTNARVMPELYTDDGAYLMGMTGVVPDYPSPTEMNLSGSSPTFRIGYITLNDNAWNRCNQIRFRVDRSNNVPFEITQCILYSGDMVIDWVSAVEDTFIENGGTNLLKNGHFMKGIQENQKVTTTHWDIQNATGFNYNYDHGFNNFKRKGIIHAYGTPSDWSWLGQWVMEPVKKDEPLTLSLDIATDELRERNKDGIKLEVFGYYMDGTNEIREGVASIVRIGQIESEGVTPGNRYMRRIGRTLVAKHDYHKMYVKVTFTPAIYVNWYITRIQLERSKVVNDFKEHPEDLDITTNAKFQAVEQTLNMYKRTIGETENGVATKVAQMVMTNQSFQTTITNASSASTNLVLDTENFAGAIANFVPGENNRYRGNFSGVYGKNEYMMSVPKSSGFTGWSVVSLPVAMSQVKRNESYTISFKIKFETAQDTPNKSRYLIALKNHVLNKTPMVFHDTRANDPRTGSNNPFTDWVTVKKTVTPNEDVALESPGLLPFMIAIENTGVIRIKEIMMVRGTVSNEYTPATGISSTIVKQLSNSYAVRVLSGPNSLATEINANPNGVRIKGENIEIDGNTHITNGVIDEAMIKNGAISSAKIANAAIDSAKVNNIDASKITGKNANLIDLDAITGRIQYIFTKGIALGNEVYMYMSNGRMQIYKRNARTDDVMLQINGRISGGTRMHGSPSTSNEYVPVMTNVNENGPIVGVNRRRVGVYGVRWIGICTFPNDGAYLYVHDGSGENCNWYLGPMTKTAQDYNPEYGIRG